MPSYEVTLKDRSVQEVDDAHAYQQEGQMTTFFRNDEARQMVDSWSRRVFSVRTSEVLMIRQRCDVDRSESALARPVPLRPASSSRRWAAEA